MSHGNNEKNRVRIPLVSWVLLGIAMLGMISGGVAAYLSYSTPVISNTFVADTDIYPTIGESMTNNVKSNVAVSVSDQEDHAVYVRAAIVVTWRRENEPEDQEILLAQAPQPGTDYTLSLNLTDTGWFEEGGFYYYRPMVNPGASTAELITACTPNVTKEGYVLNVEVMAQTIQALGTTDAKGTPAVTDAWGVQVENGQLKPTSPTP